MRVRVITVIVALIALIALIAGIMFFPFGFGTESVLIFEARRTSPNTVSLGIASCNNNARVASTELDGNKLIVEVVHPRQNEIDDCADAIRVEAPQNVTVVVDGSNSEELPIQPAPR